jgi:hypothetical protein
MESRAGEEGGVMARTILKNKAGKRVPSVTTIAGQLDKPGLVSWAHKLGLAGVTDLRGHRDALKKAGNLMHELIGTCLTGAAIGPVYFADINPEGIYKLTDTSEYTDEEIELSRPIFKRAASLLAAISPMTTGLMEYSMVSEAHQFGGRLDWYGVAGEDGPLTLMDIKIGKEVYAETIIQLAAYRGLLLELGNKVERVCAARIGPTPDDGEEMRVLKEEELDAAWKTFLHLRAVYDLQKAYKPEPRKAA